MRKALVLAAAAAVMVAFVATVNGDDDKKKPDPKIVEKIEAGLKAYKDGKGQDAISLLQEALTMLQKNQRAGLAAFFPAAPKGWEAGEVQSNTASGSDDKGQTFSYTVLDRKYVQKKGDDETADMVMNMTSSPQMVATYKGMADVYKNPEIIKAMSTEDTSMKFIDKDGWIGWQQVKKGESGNLTVFSGSVALTITVSNGDAGALETLFKSIDLKGLAKVSKATSQPAE